MELKIEKYSIRRESEKKPMKIIKYPQPRHFVDLVESKKERSSSSNEELEEGQSQMVKFRIKPKNIP